MRSLLGVSRALLWLIFAGGLCAYWLPTAEAGERQTPVKAPEPPSSRDVAPTPVPGVASPYAESWAVIVGINDYRHPRVPKLRYAVNDSQAV